MPIAIWADALPLLIKFFQWNEQVCRKCLHDLDALVKLVQLHVLPRRAHVVLVDILYNISLSLDPWAGSIPVARNLQFGRTRQPSKG